MVKDVPGLDELFEDVFRDYEPDELAVIKAKYATEGDVLEAPLLIEQTARDMIQHYVDGVLSEGFKAQIVATSRRAAVTHYDKLIAARNELVHLAYPHHQPAFRQALERSLPDWRERKEAIERRAKDYLVFDLAEPSNGLASRKNDGNDEKAGQV